MGNFGKSKKNDQFQVKSSMIYQILFQIGEIWLVYLQGFNYFNAIYDWLTIDLDHVIQIIISEQTAA